MNAGWAAAQDAVAHVIVDVLDDTCEVEGRDGHHLQRVRRLRAGEQVTAADGAGTWRGYEVGASTRGRLVLHATTAAVVEPELVPRVCVALALTKGGIETVAARLTEIGVHRVEPVRAERSVARWDDERARAVVARLQAVVREAAAQSRRARLPEVGVVADLAEVAARPGLVVAARDGTRADGLPDPPGGEWTVLIGPEGGFSPEERGMLRAAARLTLGPHVLRAETAPIAAAAVLVGRARWSAPA